MKTVVSPFQDFIVTKAWISDSVLYREGWISTDHRDRDNEITEPEAFTNVIDSYFSRSAPVSNTHDTRSYPVGHLQKGALVRDGKIFKEAIHPTDPADFTSFPETGTGFYARLAINDPIASNQVAKGNLGGCSFIASVAKTEPIPGGGRRFLEFSDLVETTIAAYPINTSARLLIAKAYGIQLEEETHTMTPEQIQAMIVAALAAEKEEVRKASLPAPLTAADITAAIALSNTSLLTQIDEKIMKATEYSRNGTGRVGVAPSPTDERDADPAAYIIRKASSGEPLDLIDKQLIAELTTGAILLGMRD